MGLYASFRDPRWRWTTWIVLVIIWTALLVMPVPEGASARIPTRGRFVISKAVHLGGYASLTVLAACLHAGFRRRLLLLFFLMAHAALTEWVQATTDLGRHGELSDVLVNHFGIALGLLLSWKRWSA